MRNRLVVLLAALLLVSAAPAQAQTPPTKPAPPDVPGQGLLDVGARVGTVDGDEARFERYRDLRPGASTTFAWYRRTDQYRFDLTASNAGYRDQRYTGQYLTGTLAVTGLFDSIPLNYLYDAPYWWQSDGRGTFTLDRATRLAIQGPTNATNDGLLVGVPCAPGAPPAACSAATAAAAIANRSVWNSFVVRDDMQVRRDIVGARVKYEATPAFFIDIDASSTGRTGEMPWNASFAFNNAVQLAVPIDQRNNELRAGTEWVHAKGMIRLDYWGSFFNNDIQTLTWDNPIRATDFNNGLLPPSGPFDPSAYVNGNGAALGQSALWPGNNLNSVGTTGMIRILPRTTINGNLNFTFMRQNEGLLPWTINTSINNPTVLAAYPGLQTLPRSSAEAAVNGTNWLVNLNSRALRFLTIQARYRYNEHANNTHHFDGRQFVTFDSAVRTIADDPNTPHLEGISEYFHITRKNVDANGTFGLRDFGSLRIGYASEVFARKGRGFSEVTEHTLRLAYDARLFDRVTIRASVDEGRRRGDGFILSGIDYETGPGGTQPGLRYYDEADRNRTRGMLVLSVNPVDSLGLFAQYTTTRDTFLGDEFIPAGREQFGLLRQHVNAWAVGADYSPNDTVTVGATYGWDEFNALQKSRNAAPPPSPEWTDPARNWTLDNNEVVNTFMAHADVLGLMQSKAELRFSYELNDSDNAFNYGGPRIAALQSAGQFIPLPNVVNTWQRFTADVRYFVNASLGVGVGFWYDDFDITDWNTVDTAGPAGFFAADGIPRIDWLGGLMTGYGNRPYSGARLFARLLYRF